MDVFATNSMTPYKAISAVAESTNAASFDATYTDRSIQATTSGSCTSCNHINPTTGAVADLLEGWAHFEMRHISSGGGTGTFFQANNATVGVWRLRATSSVGAVLEYWTGAAWANVGAVNISGSGTKNTYDVHWKIVGTQVTYEMFLNNGQIIAPTTFTTSVALTGVRNHVLLGAGWPGTSGTGGAYFSQILIADENTINAKVRSLNYTADGNYTAWVGAVADIQEVNSNDATLISSTTLGDKESYVMNDAALPANYYLASVFVNARGRLGGSSPVNVKPFLRIGGADYYGPHNVQQLNSVSFEPGIAAFPLDPSTGSAWSGVANLNAAEMGFEAAA